MNVLCDACEKHLLGRESMEEALFHPDIRRAYTGQRLLVTGAGGTIGSELARQLPLLDPACIAILDKDENSIHELSLELTRAFPDCIVQPMIADVRHGRRLRFLFKQFRPQIVFHAAAHKHVPLMEMHPSEALLNNVGGTRTVLDICVEHGVERFVFISSDKAVNPSNVMGVSKRLGELLVQAYSQVHPMRTASVRFGNVFGSRGSVIPLFQKQIEQGGPVTVTHPEIMRFFMTIPEAVQLVLCAGTMADRGTIAVLDMGNPRRILDLALEMIRLYKLERGHDIEIKIIGLRPGEKMVEEILYENEEPVPTRVDKLSIIVGPEPDAAAVLGAVSNLLETAELEDARAIGRILQSVGIGYCPQGPKAPSFAGLAGETLGFGAGHARVAASPWKQ